MQRPFLLVVVSSVLFIGSLVVLVGTNQVKTAEALWTDGGTWARSSGGRTAMQHVDKKLKLGSDYSPLGLMGSDVVAVEKRSKAFRERHEMCEKFFSNRLKSNLSNDEHRTAGSYATACYLSLQYIP